MYTIVSMTVSGPWNRKTVYGLFALIPRRYAASSTPKLFMPGQEAEEPRAVYPGPFAQGAWPGGENVVHSRDPSARIVLPHVASALPP
jgi:hypothetical protein